MSENEIEMLAKGATAFKENRNRLTGDKQNDFVVGFTTGYEVGQQIERQAWIATDERLPDELGPYLVRCANGKYRVAEYVDSRDYKGRFFRFPYFEHSHSDVTAWMPIPPYQPAQNGEKV